ncbi:unnamed protein product [Prorocentrum cordatum]|uniref:Hexosyltransferase n=1 Tax=Prorocentrum cordatum TaxID=2364126 RepID=A0ABN9SXC6_9DINO|nr:unnamed protein product [Polarella glacialis]
MGIFACDGHAAFSSKKVMLGPGVFTTAVPGDMSVKMGGPYNIALNTEVLLRVWRKVWDMDAFSSFDWVVKVDADSVFFPSRLRSHASITPGGPLFLNNCGAGLHGPIEAMTREAVWLFRDGNERCQEEQVTDWTTQGEDDYVMGCLQLLGAQQYNDFGVLSEVACGEDPSPVRVREGCVPSVQDRRGVVPVRRRGRPPSRLRGGASHSASQPAALLAAGRRFGSAPIIDWGTLAWPVESPPAKHGWRAAVVSAVGFVVASCFLPPPDRLPRRSWAAPPEERGLLELGRRPQCPRLDCRWRRRRWMPPAQCSRHEQRHHVAVLARQLVHEP